MKQIRKLDDLKNISENDDVKVNMQLNGFKFSNTGIVLSKTNEHFQLITLVPTEHSEKMCKLEYYFDKELNSIFNRNLELCKKDSIEYKNYFDRLVNLCKCLN